MGNNENAACKDSLLTPACQIDLNQAGRQEIKELLAFLNPKNSV
jgi:hypothetical protein